MDRARPPPLSSLSWGPVPLLVYVAMFAGTLGGQAAGILLDLALRAAGAGARHLWLPLACSVVVEAVVGARLGAARAGHALTPRQCARVSVIYSVALGAMSFPLLLWSLASARAKAGAAFAPSPAAWLGGLLAALVVATAARAALMIALSRRRDGGRP